MATTSIESLIQELLAWLEDNPEGDLQDFAELQGCTVGDIAEGWHNHFNEIEANRNYSIDNGPASYHPSHPPHGDDEDAKHYLVREVSNYYEYNSHIEDNSTNVNQNIIAGGDVDIDQDFDIDNSDNVASDGGVVVRDSDVDDSNLVTGDRNAVDSTGVNTGDVTTDVDDGQAAVGLNFGSGDVQQANQSGDVTVTGGAGAGGAGGAGTGGAGTSGDAGDGGDADADDGGDGGDGGAAVTG
ncbi:MAG TPA: hypothetical protein VM367_12035, partial [Pseudonocardia sp.]|nr:hypothetical protein [Pseudonocardia sp.]